MAKIMWYFPKIELDNTKQQVVQIKPSHAIESSSLVFTDHVTEIYLNIHRITKTTATNQRKLK